MIRTFARRFAATSAFLLLIPSAGIVAQTLSIENTRSLSFGSFVAGAGGSVTVATDGECTTNGSVILLPSASGQAAEFTVSGAADATYTIDLPPDGLVVLTGPDADMTVSNFTSSPSGANGHLSAGGSQTVSVGGTLNVGADQPTGQYSGNYTIYVNYN